MTASVKQFAAQPQTANAPDSSGVSAFSSSAALQQAYVIAAHAVQTNAMSMQMASDHFGVDFHTLRQFCRRIQKSIATAPQTLTPNQFAPLDASKAGKTEQMPSEKVHKKQYQLARLEKEFLMQEQLVKQQQPQKNATTNGTSPAARKEDNNSSSASKLDTSGHTRRARQIFSLQQEEELAHFVRETSAYYNGMSSKDVRTLAFVYAVCNRVDIPAGWRESSQASFDWCLGFIKRNKLSPMMTTSNMYKATQDKSMGNGKVFADANPEAEIAEC